MWSLLSLRGAQRGLLGGMRTSSSTAQSTSGRSLLHTVVSSSSSSSSGSSSPPHGGLKLEDVAIAGRKKLKSKYDAVIVGGGHNGLTCAAYLAKAGLDVLVLERRYLVGGAAVTEEIFHGFKFSRASYLCSLFRPQIIKELELQKHGFEVLPRDPYSFTPLRDGRSLLLSKDPKVTREQIAQFSKKDAEVYGDYEQLLSRLATAIEPLLDMPPPDITPPFNFKGRTRGPPPPGLWQFVKDNGLSRASKYLGVAAQLGIDLVPLFEIMTAPASTILNRWFESEPLKATLATDAIVGAMVAPSTPSSGYVLFHHVMGETNGEKGVWAYVRGGMGTISQSLASVAKHHGATILIDAPVRSILTKASDGTAKGVVLEDGTEIAANIVISNATPDVTFHRLLSPEQQKGLLPDEFRDRLRSYDYTSPVTKINVALGALPQFKCMPWRSGSSPDEVRGGRQHRGTIHLGAESLPEIEEAYRDAAALNPSRRPVVEMTLPSVLDSTVAPPGKHVAQLFVQYTPYRPAEFDWNQPGKREAFAERVFDVVEEYCPGFKNSIEGVDILTPPDLERVFGLTGGNIGHGAFGLDQLYWLRPAAGYTNYRSPIPGLYLCGAGCHPGGGVMGAPGRNASKIILSDQGLPTAW